MRRLVDGDHGLDDVDDAKALYFDGGTFLVVVDDGRIVGTGALARLSDAVCELDRMWLLPSIDAAASAAASSSASSPSPAGAATAPCASTRTASLQGAIQFYEGLGFRRIPSYREAKYSDVYMEREL